MWNFLFSIFEGGGWKKDSINFVEGCVPISDFRGRKVEVQLMEGEEKKLSIFCQMLYFQFLPFDVRRAELCKCRTQTTERRVWCRNGKSGHIRDLSRVERLLQWFLRLSMNVKG